MPHASPQSTTIHHICGSHFRSTANDVDVLEKRCAPSLQPAKVVNKGLIQNQVAIAQSTSSQTRYITSVLAKASDVGFTESEIEGDEFMLDEIYLCDTPG
jgi:hypothetical protein